MDHLLAHHRFPSESPSKAMQDADAFYEAHGGRGPQIIYASVEACRCLLSGEVFKRNAPARDRCRAGAETRSPVGPLINEATAPHR
ncbi:hypothetical protein V8J82_06290 [Gymnodinialimonas sp. 2305UL16-5]|uniref:hypothetical protein n=1 Tax=Gymnodinialimonas mytili TaxID=3126503 RepID=UPI0030B12F5A